MPRTLLMPDVDQPITDLADPRIAPYRNLKDRELAREGDLFIAEGEYVVRRLLDSDYPVHSVLLSSGRYKEMSLLVPAGVPVFVAADAVVHQIVGFKFHSGVMAIGRRKPRRPLEAFLPANPAKLTVVICPETANAENMGSLIRISSAFGADAMILGENCCDPYWRQSIRVSMGTVFRLPLHISRDLERDLRRLKAKWSLQLAAAVTSGDAEPLASVPRPPRLGILFGNEAQGLSASWLELCDRRVTIPMHLGTDSLNVSVAAAVFLYHFTKEV